MTAVFSDVRAARPDAAHVLIAVHGGEPAGWAPAVRRAVTRWPRPSVRVLAVVAVPCPPFTSLIPPGARMYRAARATWEAAERTRVQRVIDDVVPTLPAGADIVWLPVSYGDPARGIAEHARLWAADALLIAGSPAAGPWLGAVHLRVIRDVRCRVLPITPFAQREGC